MVYIDKNIDILITMTPSDYKSINRVSGHIFEIIDYYIILKEKFKIKVLICDYKKDDFINLIKRYNLPSKDIDDNFIFKTRPNFIRCRNILLVDGIYDFKNIVNIGNSNLICFSCGNSYFKNNDERPKNVLFLEDHRIYKNKPNSINYVKKILPFKKPNNFKDRTFIHLTGDCRKYNHLELIEKYPNCLIFSDYLQESYNITNKPVSIGDFNKYIYTPISRKFDCSPRLIAECDYLGILVEYYNIDYYDIGLETRKLDIKNKNYLLTEDDEIFNILKENLK